MNNAGKLAFDISGVAQHTHTPGVVVTTLVLAPYAHAHCPQAELSKSPDVAAWLMDVARGRWSDFPIFTKPAYMAACQIALAEPAGESSVAYTVTDALWRAIMKHGGAPAAAISGLQVLARTAEADGFEDREEDSDEDGDAEEGRQLRVIRTLLHHHKACSEVVKLCARYGLGMRDPGVLLTVNPRLFLNSLAIVECHVHQCSTTCVERYLLLHRVLRYLAISRESSTSWDILNDLCEGLQVHLSDADALKEGMGTLAHHLPLLPAPDPDDYGIYHHPARAVVDTAQQIWAASTDNAALRVGALTLWHLGLGMSAYADKTRLVTALESMLSSPGEGYLSLSCVL